MNNEQGGAGPGVDSTEQAHADEAARAEFTNETRAYAANNGGQEYLNEVADLHAEADRATAQAAAEHQPQPAPAEGAPAGPSVEQARANVAAAAPETPAPAAAPVVPSAEALAAPAPAEQASNVQQSGNPVMRELRLFVHDVRGLFYRGRHAATKSGEQDPRQK